MSCVPFAFAAGLCRALCVRSPFAVRSRSPRSRSRCSGRLQSSCRPTRRPGYIIGPFSFPNPFVRPPSERRGLAQRRQALSSPQRIGEPDGRRQAFGGGAPCTCACGPATAASFRCPIRARAGLPWRRVPGPLSQRRGRALYDAFRRHDRRGRVGSRRALLGAAERLQVPADLRPDLLLPAPGSELGGRARRGGAAIWPPLTRHRRDRGGLRPDVAPEAGPERPGDRPERRAADRRCGSGRRGFRSTPGSTSRASTRGSRRRRRPSAARLRASRTTKTNVAVHLGLKAGRVVEDRAPDGGTRRVRILTPSF